MWYAMGFTSREENAVVHQLAEVGRLDTVDDAPRTALVDDAHAPSSLADAVAADVAQVDQVVRAPDDQPDGAEQVLGLADHAHVVAHQVAEGGHAAPILHVFASSGCFGHPEKP